MRYLARKTGFGMQNKDHFGRCRDLQDKARFGGYDHNPVISVCLVTTSNPPNGVLTSDYGVFENHKKSKILQPLLSAMSLFRHYNLS